MQEKKKRKFKKTKYVKAPPKSEKKTLFSFSKKPSHDKSKAVAKEPLLPHMQVFPKRFSHAISHWMKKHDSDIQLILFPAILLVILLILTVFNNQFVALLSKQEPVTDDQISSLHPYPYVQAIGEPTLSAKAAIILDRGSQVILFSKNPQLRFSMASTTKIMTALVGLNYYKPTDILTVKQAGVAGSGLNLYPGEEFHFIDLLYAMLLPSANDAAQAIADNYPGGADAFIAQMNQKAQSLHLNNTHYSDPIGLDDDGDYSTVIDMSRLASYAIANPNFVDVTSTKYKTITDVHFTRQYPLTNLNKLLGIDGVTGIKTGTTEGAGEVLVTSTTKNGHTYIIVVMDSTDRFYDTSQLLHFIDANVKYVLPPTPDH